ncbi:MAG: hypothetical protein OEV42_09710 [Deltaproteobacteria bacterium]|nr:hypothetical protein [Deltaproteobacteria bacterium]
MNDMYDNQVGPGVQGKGSIAIYTNRRTAKILYSPQDESRSTALYNINSARPDKPLPVGEWLEIPNADNVYIDYEVEPEGDIKICWSL